jgi:hypothetical protein
MTNNKIITRLFTLLLFIVTSCSDNEISNKCEQTNITILIDGELLTFEAISRGILLTSNGYKLTVGFNRRVESPLVEQNILITLPYKKTGKNIIKNFFYSQYKNSVYFEGDFINGELQSNVTKNSKSCFSTTFNGKLNNGTQDIVIESVKVSYQYQEPFDE